MGAISLFNTLFYVSLGVAVLGLLLAVFFFFYFDIPTVRALMTGSAKRKAIENMNEQNSRTGKLRKPITESTAPRKGPVIQPPPQARHEDNAPTESTRAAAPASQETTILRDETETTILRDENETTLLNQDQGYGETVLLSSTPPKPSVRFEMTENTVVVHTNEFI